MMSLKSSPENFAKFRTEVKPWIDRTDVPLSDIEKLGKQLASWNGVSLVQLIEEWTEYIRSPDCTLSAEEKDRRGARWESIVRLTSGSDPKLYGRTLDDKEFDWKRLRGKYVLIKFTATWCGPCKRVLPDMREAYDKYHDKGLEIVSVYIWEEDDSDPVATVKKSVEQEKLPWIILSETLTEQAKQPKQGDFYGCWNFVTSHGVPTMVLADKEGKIIMTDDQIGSDDLKGLKAKLAEIFK
jgi:thiol-disulfide isomerase/thioredoxin